MVKLGPKSQIVIPKEVRDLFNLAPGDSLLLLADRDRGIALVDPEEHSDVIDSVMGDAPLAPSQDERKLRAGRKPPPSIAQRTPSQPPEDSTGDSERGE